MKPTIFSPTVLEMLLSPGEVSDDRLIQLTLADLVYRQVLTIYQRPTDSAVVICLGPRYEAFRAAHFQKPFLKPYQTFDDEFLWEDYYQQVLGHVGKNNRFKRQCVAPWLHEAGWLHRLDLVSRANAYWLTQEGRLRQRAYKQWIAKADILWQQFSKTTRPELSSFFRSVGSHVVLLPSFSRDTSRKVLAHSEGMVPMSDEYPLWYGLSFLRCWLLMEMNFEFTPAGLLK